MDFLGIGIGLPQLLLVLIVAMLVLGPERLPEVARQLARGIRTLRGYANDVQQQFEGELGDLRAEFLDIQQDLASVQGNLRSGLLELDAGVRSVQNEVGSALTSAASGQQSGNSSGETAQSEPEPAPSLDYVPASPKSVTYRPPAIDSINAEAAVAEPADGRLPDYRPGSKQ